MNMVQIQILSAAMTGGLMGCLSGKDWLPSQWSGVQDAKIRQGISIPHSPWGQI